MHPCWTDFSEHGFPALGFHCLACTSWLVRTFPSLNLSDASTTYLASFSVLIPCHRGFGHSKDSANICGKNKWLNNRLQVQLTGTSAIHAMGELCPHMVLSGLSHFPSLTFPFSQCSRGTAVPTPGRCHTELSSILWEWRDLIFKVSFLDVSAAEQLMNSLRTFPISLPGCTGEVSWAGHSVFLICNAVVKHHWSDQLGMKGRLRRKPDHIHHIRGTHHLSSLTTSF